MPVSTVNSEQVHEISFLQVTDALTFTHGYCCAVLSQHTNVLSLIRIGRSRACKAET